MKLIYKFNLLSVLILAVMTILVLVVGTVIINELAYDLKRQLLYSELTKSRQTLLRAVNSCSGPRAAEQAMDAFSADLKKEPIGLTTGGLHVVEAPNRVLFHTHKPAGDGIEPGQIEAMFQRKEGYLEYTYQDVSRYAVFTTIPSLEWLLVLSIDKTEIYAREKEYLVRIGFITVLIIGVSALVFSLFARRFVRRLRTTVDCVRQIEEGDLEARIVPTVKNDELARLQTGVNAMSAKIRVRTRERERTEKALRQSEERFRLVFENSPVPIWEVDFSAVKLRLDELQGTYDGDIESRLRENPEIVKECLDLVRILNVNTAVVDLLEAHSKADLMPGPQQIFLHETFDAFRQQLVALVQGRTQASFDMPVKTLTGQRREVTTHFSVSPGHERSLSKIIISMVDVTERNRAEEGLRLAASVFANSQEGIVISDVENRIIDVNPAFCSLTGYTREEALGNNPGFISSGRHTREFYAEMWQSINTTGAWQGELWNRRKSGEVYAELLSVVAVKDEQGKLHHYVGAFTDISVLKEHEAELNRIAHYDVLTSVPNRRLLGDRLEQAIARARRLGKNLAVCYLDLDGFKPINDQFGHEAGDMMLIEIARRLEAMSRADDTVARLGGDEFVLLWNDIGTEADCVGALERVLHKVAEPMLMGEEPVSVSASIGVTLFPVDDVDADSLLRHADHAMYSAKQLGKNRYQMFDARLERQIAARVELLAKVVHGLDTGEFEFYYQPKVNCAAATVDGVEALLRWNDPVLGLVGPKEFLPLIEDDSLAFRMGRWLLEQAVRQAKTWNDMGIMLPVSVNVFPRHLRYQTFIDDLRNAIASNWPQMPGNRLLIEIIESSALEELEPIEQVIKQCLGMGVGFSLDDFGTGYSSLVYLRALSIEELKIDQSFIRDMLDDPNDQAIVIGVIGLGQAFGLRVVAEGVETAQQVRHLVDLGCSVVQGYGLGKPMPPGDFEEWYRDFQANGVKMCS